MSEAIAGSASDEPCQPGCHICAGCKICTESPAEPQDWDGPYQAYRWSPEVEDSSDR